MDYLLMMDQDSYASPNLIGDYLNMLENIKDEIIGIISPNYIYKNYNAKFIMKNYRRLIWR